jgi:hypothetical protein
VICRINGSDGVNRPEHAAGADAHRVEQALLRSHGSAAAPLGGSDPWWTVDNRLMAVEPAMSSSDLTELLRPRRSACV